MFRYRNWRTFQAAVNFTSLTHHQSRCYCPSPGKRDWVTMQGIRRNIAKIFKSYALKKYVNYVKNYDKILENRFPRAMHVYRVFSVGIKDFYQDTKSFVRIRGQARNALKSGAGIASLPRKDVEIFYRMPQEMLKVAPVLVISALPLANYIVFPIAYFFPKHLLSSHFWSLQQRYSFALEDHTKKLQYFRPTFRNMQLRVVAVSDQALHDHLNMVLSKLASGVHPTIPEVLAIKSLFGSEPFHLNCLYPRHKNNLLRLHGLHTLWSRRRRLAEHATKLYDLDRAIEREGVTSLSSDELRWACFTRGLNPSSMRTDDMIQWMEQWTSITAHVDQSTMSLLLHCPILLAYNQPTNRVLMHHH